MEKSIIMQFKKGVSQEALKWEGYTAEVVK